MSDELKSEVDRTLKSRPGRVTRLTTGSGQTWWLKRVERLSLRLRLQKVVLLNMAALGVSAIGLMLVVTGIFLA